MTPVVIDACAGVELAADTVRGRALRGLLPDGLYVALAEHLDALLLADDQRLARTPGLTVQTLVLP